MKFSSFFVDSCSRTSFCFADCSRSCLTRPDCTFLLQKTLTVHVLGSRACVALLVQSVVKRFHFFWENLHLEQLCGETVFLPQL